MAFKCSKTPLIFFNISSNKALNNLRVLKYTTIENKKTNPCNRSIWFYWSEIGYEVKGTRGKVKGSFSFSSF